MRISDWSSDVCSSDLEAGVEALLVRHGRAEAGLLEILVVDREAGREIHVHAGQVGELKRPHAELAHVAHDAVDVLRLDRESVVWGKSVSVRLDIGGRRIIKKKKTEQQIKQQNR